MAQSLKGASRDMTRLRPQAVCRACRRTLHRRHASTAAAPAEPSVLSASQSSQPPPPVAAAAPSTAWTVRTGVVLSRPPQITRDLTPFEKAFFLYQRRMNERTAMPFPRYFYIPKQTPADVDWKRQIKERRTPGRDIGRWSAWDRDEGWNDELLVGSTISEPAEQVERLLDDAVIKDDGGAESAKSKEVVERPQPRVTEADKENDTRSLNRALTRTLYLLVKGKDGRWSFPSGLLEGQESLARAAERLIVQTGGINMNTWVVGNAPVGHHTWKFREPQMDKESQLEKLGEKVFFMKARIMAGKASLKDSPLGIVDHQWLAKEELPKVLHPSYWSSVKNMLSEL